MHIRHRRRPSVLRPFVDLPLGRKLANFPKRRPPCNVCACPACLYRTSATLSTSSLHSLPCFLFSLLICFSIRPGAIFTHSPRTCSQHSPPSLSPLSLVSLFVALSALQKGKIIIRHCMVIEIIVILFMSPSSPPRQLTVLWRDYHCIAPGGEGRGCLHGMALPKLGDNYFKRTVIEFIII